MSTVEIPKGYRVDRDERLDYFTRDPERRGTVREVVFRLIAVVDGHESLVTTVAARFDARFGEWLVQNGSQRSTLEPDEARARVALLLMAVDEVERRRA